ncbi:MAG: hypothetical protein ACOY40_17295 [Bacillota bacterium]
MKLRWPKKGLFLMAVTAVILLFGTVLAGSAGSGDPGSADDPLVTRSYVEAQINSRLNEAVKIYAEKYMQWQAVELSPGQRLIGAAGTEFIVRVGNTVVIDTTGNGIPDVTGGVNVAAGQAVALNHHFIIPRADGRGIVARTKAAVMYKGEIQIK